MHEFEFHGQNLMKNFTGTFVFSRALFNVFSDFFTGTCVFFTGKKTLIGGTPVKRISECLFCPLCFLFLGFIGIIGGPLINVFQRVYFDGLCFFNFYYLVFIGIIGGTPDKRISEGLF